MPQAHHGALQICLTDITESPEQKHIEAWQWRCPPDSVCFWFQDWDVLGILLVLPPPIRIESEDQTVWVCSQSMPTTRVAKGWQRANLGEQEGADLDWNIDIEGQSLLILRPLIFSQNNRVEPASWWFALCHCYSQEHLALQFYLDIFHFLLQISFSSTLVRSATLLPRSLWDEHHLLPGTLCSGKLWSRKTNPALTPSLQPAVSYSHLTLPAKLRTSNWKRSCKSNNCCSHYFLFFFFNLISRTSESLRTPIRFALITYIIGSRVSQQEISLCVWGNLLLYPLGYLPGGS